MREGASVVTGGGNLAMKGFFYRPTVLAGLNPEMSVVSGGDFRVRAERLAV